MARSLANYSRPSIISVARGASPADLLLKNAQVMNVFSGEIHRADVAVYEGRVVGFGDYEAGEVVDLAGAYLSPGFIDGHVHIESSMVPPAEYATAVVPRGTTAVVADPHEIANVHGLEGLRYMLRSAEQSPLRAYFMLPSCVPASPFETPGAHLGPGDLAVFVDNTHVLGIGEMMDFPGVLAEHDEVVAKLRIAGDKRVDGHAPGVSGRDLCAYVAAGISSDHECTTLEEAEEKLRLGMHIHVREGSTARNLETLLPLAKTGRVENLSLVTDDKSPEDLLSEGGIDFALRRAVELGLPPIDAVRMATISTARHYRLDHIGAIAPGYYADLVVLPDLQSFTPSMVFIEGQLRAKDGKMVAAPSAAGPAIRKSVLVDWGSLDKIAVPAPKSGKAETKRGPRPRAQERVRVRVIEMVPDQLITGDGVRELPIGGDGLVHSDTRQDILKIVVVERHHHTGNVGVGFVSGFGLKHGALASSIGHDSHNIVAVGVEDEAIVRAIREIGRMQGGIVAVEVGPAESDAGDGEGRITSLPLPIAGLMSDLPIAETAARLKEAKKAARRLGCRLSEPFMALSFVPLAVIPKLKLTDLGLVDVERFEFVPLIVGDR